MKDHTRSLIFIPLFLLVAATANSQIFPPGDAVESVGPGTVNWTTGEVYAVGIGAPPASGTNPAQTRAMAERAAHVVALRNLLETVKGVRVNADTVVENYLVKSDVIKTRVGGIVKGAHVVKKRYLSDGSVEMLVAMPVRGAFLNAITPETFGREVPGQGRQAPAPKDDPGKKAEPAKPPLTAPEKRAEPVPPTPAHPAPPPSIKVPEPSTPTLPVEPEKKREPVPAPAPPQTEKKPAPAPALPDGTAGTMAFKGGIATGVVIDGRGLGLRPALLPKVVDPQGEEIYVGQVVTRTNAVEQGVAGYAKDVNAATNNFRVTDNPAVIKGVQAAGASRTDIVVAQTDARALRELGAKGDFLSNCRVIIVY